MPEEEEKKKRTKKLVVEETSAPEPVIEAEIPTEKESPEQLDSEEATEEKAESEIKEPEEESVVSEKETPRKSILIPAEEKEGEISSGKAESQDSKVSIFWVFLLALFIIASLVGGGILIFRAGVEKGKLETGGNSGAVASPTPSPAASAPAEVKREDLKVKILNGTGKAGVAAGAKEYLEGLGYKNVETGNADTADFTQAVISIKDAKKSYLETLRKDLSGKYEVSAAASTLSSGNDFDAIVTVGTSTK